MIISTASGSSVASEPERPSVLRVPTTPSSIEKPRSRCGAAGDSRVGFGSKKVRKTMNQSLLPTRLIASNHGGCRALNARSRSSHRHRTRIRVSALGLALAFVPGLVFGQGGQANSPPRRVRLCGHRSRVHPRWARRRAMEEKSRATISNRRWDGQRRLFLWSVSGGPAAAAGRCSCRGRAAPETRERRPTAPAGGRRWGGFRRRARSAAACPPGAGR